MIAHIRSAHGEGPTLVYVPGIDGTGELLLGTAPRLCERFRLVTLSYEAEPRADHGDDYAPLAASIARALDQQRIGSALVLAESFGGAVALQLALDHPDRVKGLAIVNGFAHYDARLRLAVTRLVAPLVPRPLFRLGRRTAPHTLLAPRRDDEVLSAFHGVTSRGFDDGYRRRLAMIGRLDLRARLAEVQRPVALFASDRDRVLDAVAAARAMASALPDATLEILPRAGHLVLPLPEEPWLQRIEALQARGR